MVTKRPFRIRSVCWHGENNCRTIGNDALRALGQDRFFKKKEAGDRHREFAYEGKPMSVSIHGVWRPLKDKGGLSRGVLRDTDLMLVPAENMFHPEAKAFRMVDAELWKDEKAMKLLREHQEAGRVVYVRPDMSTAELRGEILKRLKRLE